MPHELVVRHLLKRGCTLISEQPLIVDSRLTRPVEIKRAKTKAEFHASQSAQERLEDKAAAFDDLMAVIKEQESLRDEEGDGVYSIFAMFSDLYDEGEWNEFTAEES